DGPPAALPRSARPARRADGACRDTGFREGACQAYGPGLQGVRRRMEKPAGAPIWQEVNPGGIGPMFSKDLEYSIGQCYKRAREARDEYMTAEHLLLALLDNPSAETVLKACGADFARLRSDLEQAIASSVSRLADDDGRDTQPTLGFQRVLQRAVYHVQSSGKKEVSGANVLVAIFGEKDSHAVYFLNQQDVTRLDVVNYLS